jgi:hypothetical protein
MIDKLKHILLNALVHQIVLIFRQILHGPHVGRKGANTGQSETPGKLGHGPQASAGPVGLRIAQLCVESRDEVVFLQDGKETVDVCGRDRKVGDECRT